MFALLAVDVSKTTEANRRKNDTTLLRQIAPDDVLDSAYEWLCRRRCVYPADADVWLFSIALPSIYQSIDK